MTNSLSENDEEQATMLVFGQPLPPSSLDKKFVEVKRHHKVIWAEAPPVLQDLNAPEWMSTPFLKNTFRLPRTGRQRKGSEVSQKFPYCLLAFGSAGTSLRERLIVVNWYLNLSDDERKAVWDNVKVRFITPTKSPKLFNEYDPANPKAIGIGDTVALREERAKQTRSYKVLAGGPRVRKSVNHSPQTNAQLRDAHVKEPEARAQQYLARTIKRSRVTEGNKENVKAHYEPVLTTTSTAFSPVSRGKPSQDVRRVPKVSHFARDRVGLRRNFEPIVAALKANRNLSSIEDLTSEDVVQSLEMSEGHTLYYADDESNWPGKLYLEKKYNSSNVLAIDSIQGSGGMGDDETSQGGTSQETAQTYSTMSDWLGDY